jgi:hypothetical protein
MISPESSMMYKNHFKVHLGPSQTSKHTTNLILLYHWLCSSFHPTLFMQQISSQFKFRFLRFFPSTVRVPMLLYLKRTPLPFLSSAIDLQYLSYSTWQPVCSSIWRLDLSSAWRPNSSILPDILSVLCLAAKSFAWRPEFLYAWPPDLLWAWQVEHLAGNQVYLVLVYLFCSYLTEEIGKLSCSVLAVIFSAFSDINITFSFDLTCINIYSASTPTPTSAHHSIDSYIYSYPLPLLRLHLQGCDNNHNRHYIFLSLHSNMPLYLHLHLHPLLQECW